MKKSLITEDELKMLLVAIFHDDELKFDKMHRALELKQSGDQIVLRSDGVIIRRKIIDLLCGVVAKRLKKNRRSVKLFSLRDYNKLFQQIENICVFYALSEFEHLTVTEWEKFKENVFHYFMNTIFEIVSNREDDPYGEYWRIVEFIVDSAAKEGGSLTGYLSSGMSTDKIVRYFFSRRQYLAIWEEKIANLTDIDLVPKALVQSARKVIFHLLVVSEVERVYSRS